MPGSASSPALSAIASAFGVKVESTYAVNDEVRNAAQHAATVPFEPRSIQVGRGRYLCCGCDASRAIIVLGPYRRPEDEESDLPLLSADSEQRAEPALCHAARAFCELEQTRHDRLEIASQLELVGSAIIAITGHLSVETVLRRIVDLARELAGARYAALGVPNDQGELENFITSGMTRAEEEAIGSLPKGRGILGLLLREPRIIRLTDLHQHPDSIGFPPNHPPMKSFLGVPLVTHGRVVGNLYLTEKRTGTEFTEEDARLVEILARHAAVAIENAQLYRRLELDRLRLNLLIDQLPEAIIMVEPDPERVTIVNQQASELLGWDIQTPAPLDEFLSHNPRFDLEGNPVPLLEVPLVRALRRGDVLRPHGNRSSAAGRQPFDHSRQRRTADR